VRAVRKVAHIFLQMQVVSGEMQFFGMRLLPSNTVQHVVAEHAVLRITNVSLDASISAVAIGGVRAVLVMNLANVMQDFAVATLSGTQPHNTIDVYIPGPATVTFAVKGNAPICVCGYQLAGSKGQEAVEQTVQQVEVDREEQENNDPSEDVEIEGQQDVQPLVEKMENNVVEIVPEINSQESAPGKAQDKEQNGNAQSEKKKMKKEKKEGQEGKKKISCKLCSKRFVDPAHLSAHVKSKHAFQHKQKIANLLGKTL
jgi:hypothetical protein